MSGIKDGTSYNYLTQMGYDKFEQRVFMSYGNGTETSYSYEPERRRLLNMTALTSGGREMMNNAYGYDQENNILQLTNSAPRPPSNLMGGSSQYNFVYDDLYRLIVAEGEFNGSNHDHRYSLIMNYNSIHSITQKDQVHERKGLDETEWDIRNKTTYGFDYEYDPLDQPHAPIHIGDKSYTYDANGNQLGWEHDVNGQNRKILWDEENRMFSLSDNGQSFSYFYDADHMRVFKSIGGGHTIDINGAPVIDTGGIGNTIIYPNQYLVIRSGGATKHFFIENQRIASKLAESSDGLLQEGVVIPGDILAELNYVPGKSKGNKNGNNGKKGKGNGKDMEAFQYFFHPDHLGSSSFITDLDGEVYQHLEYFAFGETFVEEHSNTHRTPYLFNGKELDEETGLYYYGMRYYDPVTSIWESVDPVADRLPSYSPYIYSLNNPITYADPDGRFPIAPILWWAGKRAAAGAIADIAVQLASEWVMGGGSMTDAWGRMDIDEWQVIRSSGENLVSGKYSSAALSAAGDMITYMMQNEDWTWEGALLSAGEGGISALLEISLPAHS